MKVLFHKYIATMLAVLVFFSTVSFTVAKHYCGDYLMDTALFSKAESCAMQEHMDCENEISEHSCCSNQVVNVESHDDLIKITFDHLSYDQQVFLLGFGHSYLACFTSVDQKKDHFKNHSPPPLVRDLLNWNQVYLI